MESPEYNELFVIKKSSTPDPVKIGIVVPAGTIFLYPFRVYVLLVSFNFCHVWLFV